MGVHTLFDGLTEVGLQVIPVVYLLGLGRSNPCAFAVTVGAVPADHLDLGVAAKPSRQVLAFTAVVKMQRPVGSAIQRITAPPNPG